MKPAESAEDRSVISQRQWHQANCAYHLF